MLSFGKTARFLLQLPNTGKLITSQPQSFTPPAYTAALHVSKYLLYRTAPL